MLGLAGAVVGGVIGFFVFQWALRQGFYLLALPGMLVGLGGSLLIRRRSMALAIVCGVLAVLLGIFSEWKCLPFTADDSLGYFLSHLGDLRAMTLIMLVLGGFCGFYFALGRRQGKS
jgi:hypothetical membrane protein